MSRSTPFWRNFLASKTVVADFFLQTSRLIQNENRKESNAFAKHLALYHPEEQGNIENFKIQVESVFKKSLTRQKTEAVKIQSSRATHIMNSKAEHRQPAMLRVRMTREIDDNGTNNGQRQGGRVARGDVVRRAGD